MASLTGQLVAETYKALLKVIDNDVLTASEKQITDGFGGGSNVFIDSNGFLRANKYKVTNGLATQFLKADGSLDSNTYLTGITSSQIITALGYTPVTNARTLTINGTTYDLSANRSWTIEGTAAVWGNISGTLSNQTDLQTALNAKFNNPTGTISQYIRGDGSLATFPTITGLLPTGGTAGQILAKIDATNYNAEWIDNYATQTKNEVKLGATLAKGTPVYVSSANGTNMIVSASSNTTEATSSKTFGLLETGGVTNDQVKCVTFGLIAGLNTSTATAGDPVWLGPSGTLLYGIANKPVAPAHMVYIGVVTRVQSNNGEIFVNIQNGFEIEELHDVLITNKQNNQGIFYESSTSLWKNKTIADVLGYTPQAQLSGTGFVKASGTTISYDNSTYLTTADAASTYQRLDKMVSNLLASSTEYPNSNAVINALALKANAANPVFTGDLTISGATPRLYFTDTDQNPDYTVFIDSGFFYIYDQTAGATRLSINSSGNISIGTGKSITAGSFIKESGTAAQFLKADGSIDSSTYVTSATLSSYLLSSTAASTYQRLDKMVSNLLASDTEYPNSNAVLAKLALKADAANPVFTGDMTISGASPKLYFVDTDQNPDYTLFADAGYFYIYDQTAGATRLSINSSGNINSGVGKSITAGSFIKESGTSSQVLMADGSVSAFPSLSGYALLNGNTANQFNAFEFSFAATAFNPASASRTTIDPMSIKMWQNYFSGTGLGSDYGTVLQYYSLSGHVESQVYFDASGGSWYRTASYNANYGSWQKYVTENSGTWNINISGNAATATLASNSNALNGWSYTSYAYRSSGSGYYQIDTWMSMNGNHGIFWPSYYGLHLYPNQSSYGALQINGAKNGWSGIYFYDGGNTLMMNPNESGHYRDSYGWQFRWYNGGMYVSTNANGGGSEGTVWHSLNAPRANYSNLMYYAGFTLDANAMPDNSNGFTYAQNALFTGPIMKFGDGGYAMQINGTYSGGTSIAYRTRNGDAGTWNSWYTFITTANISSQSVNYATTAGNTNSISNSLGNNNIWQGLNYYLTNQGSYLGSLSNARLQVYNTDGGSAFMSFHRSGNYAVNFGLDADNVMRIGGWSAAANRWQLDMSGNNTLAGYISANAHFDGPLATNRNASTGVTTGRVYGPSGGAYSFSGGNITGAIKIRLPFRANDCMWSMKVRIYNYSAQQTSEYTIGNYSYSNGFYNSSASFSGGSSAIAQTVRFGNEGGYDCVWIGETSTSWSYPIVSVMDFMGGYSNGNTINSYQNWDIGIVSAFGTIGGSLNPDIKFNNVFAYTYYDSSNTSYYTQPSGTSTLNIIQLAGRIKYNSSVANDSRFGLFFDSSESDAYAIFREPGSWGYPYPDLRIAFHTGISLGANPNYGGIRFFSDYDMSTVVLYVNNGSYGGAGNVYAVGTITATAFYESSDIRLKKVIDNYADIKGIENLQARLYEKDGKIEFGYYAQDAQELMPYAITKNADGFLSLSYREVHTAKIARLEKRVAELEKQLNLN